ncbi:very long chain fatty acid elongase 4-like [Chironomus tepperi]|uniref:very long chain fatty acid elongase 4-like n=1 Tax=Chironomus tepperi TaxID=113505 RepID=UPI00391F79CD
MFGSAVKEVKDLYQWLDKFSDPRTKDFPLVEDPYPVCLIVLMYFIGIWGLLRYMENKKPYKLNKVMIFYNITMACVSLKIFITAVEFSYVLGHKFVCEPYKVSYHRLELKLLNNNWWYYISKIVEFSDTLFFILRKKNSQLSFLHIYHHSSIFFLCWIVMKWFPSGSVVSALILNSFVHVVMYTYYGLSAFGNRVKKYLWWKKYLTAIQIIQFLIALYIATSNIIYGCNYPFGLKCLGVLYAVSYLVLFGNFYRKSYQKKLKKHT